MERLVLLCLLSPAIFAQSYKTKDPNDEPFLPIHPVYPYNPKLIKRGTERELISQLTPELYVPKVDAKDSYSSTYNNQGDSYYPDYNPYSKNSSPSFAYPSYYSGDPYAYTNSPYTAYNSYPKPYSMNPTSYPVPTYPNYYYQSPYYYPHYFNHALFPPQSSPPPPPSSVDHETSQDSAEAEDDKQDKEKKMKKPKEDETNQDTSANQFIDGGNYISGSSRDLDGQSSTYKIGSPYNQLEQDVQVKNLPIPLPKTTYRVISVAGQPVGPDYPLPASYAKAQQMEQLKQILAKLLTQNVQASQSYENSRDILNNASDGSYANQDAYNPNSPYVTLPGVRTKTGVDYMINPYETLSNAKVNGERANFQGQPTQRTSNKNTKYSNVHYIQKPASQAVDHSQTTHAPPDNNSKHRDHVIDNRPTDQTDEYGSYTLQSYSDIYSQSDNKQKQNYGSYQSQPSSYRSKDFTNIPQTPQSFSYQYSAYESDQLHPRSQQDKINSDDGNFGVKQYNKG